MKDEISCKRHLSLSNGHGKNHGCGPQAKPVTLCNITWLEYGLYGKTPSSDPDTILEWAEEDWTTGRVGSLLHGDPSSMRVGASCPLRARRSHLLDMLACASRNLRHMLSIRVVWCGIAA